MREPARPGAGSEGWEELGPKGPGSSCSCPPDSATKAMVTEISIGQEDFQQLQAEEGVAITFCLKEFRVRVPPYPHHSIPLSWPRPYCLLSSQGLLSFAESANLSLSIHFDAPGR